ncbi:LysR family transcriptional regulator [Novosphingobium album (ex Hu et al. 2023)]|uniref:LysR family transcriptional regulator n=1 Tax=Novosphingobium album (ex Hu et al. 2023) TaxID=2930093 RepID=A0ABT0B3A5_9SPHN|nr:LysR family transcriptional regulator [Novosphingobium album (ex Hu et al. 2023)]MCJ2179531.1 LysR family transcriptional regulator [Novosphingobium album (ex Hu et al. 2023)]
MITLTRLRHVIAVARSLSFSIAAEECGISQPALSRSIQAFEEEYAVRLFDRGKGAVTLTPAGRLAVEQARTLLAAVGEFDADMRRFGKGRAGRLGIGMGPMMASLLLPALGKVLLRESPRLTLVTRTGRPDTMLEALLEGTLDLIVANAWQLSMVPGVAEEPLGQIEMVTAVRAGHPLAERGTVSMSGLDAYPSAQTYDYGTQAKAGAMGGIVCENFGIAQDIVRDTDCSWLVARALIADDLASGRLVALDVPGLPVAKAEISLVYLRERTRSPAALHLASHIRTLVADMTVA